MFSRLRAARPGGADPGRFRRGPHFQSPGLPSGSTFRPPDGWRRWFPAFRWSVSPIMRALCLMVLLLAGTPAVLAQLPMQMPVQQIIITNVGPQTVSDAMIRANIRVKVGDKYNPVAVDEDIKNLYATGYFYNVRVNPQPSAEGVTLTYALQGKPKLTDIKFTGNKKYSNAKLTKKLTSKLGQPLDERKLFTDAQEIKKLYQKAGYQQTDVKYSISIDERLGRGTATFEIIEAPKVRIIDVYFEGAQAFKQKKLRKEIKTRRHWMFSWITGSGVLKEDQLEDDKDKLAEFYRNEGYIDFELKDVRYVYETARKLVLHFVIYEGTRYRVGAVDFKGATLFPTTAITPKLKMKVGDIFTPKGLTQDIEAIEDLYGAKGYIDVHYPTTLRVVRKPNVQTGTMDLLFEIDEGGKSYIERIDIKGNTKTKDRVIRRELAVAPGEVFDMVKVKLSKQRLEGTQFFDRVETSPEPTDVPDRKNLQITVNERNTGNIGLGAGFSSVDSILGFVEVTQGNFDLFNPPWFMGGGQKLRLRAQIGALREDYELTFIEPWFLGKKLAFSVDLYHRDLRYLSIHDFYNERRTGGRLGLTRALGSDFLIGGVSYTLENITIYDVPTNAPPAIRAEEGSRLVSKVGASLAYDTRNSVMLPDHGQRTELRAELAGGPFGGDTDTYKLDLGSHWFFPGPFKGHVLEVAGRAGVVDRYDSTTQVPLFDRWFLGGLDSLRGFRYGDVGPKQQGEPIGGDTYWLGSVEYSVPIIQFLRFAAFYDIGMVYEDPFSFDQKNTGTGVYNDNWGVGLRLNIPMLGAPIRLDYGIPIKSDPENKSNGRFQFSVGYTRPF